MNLSEILNALTAFTAQAEATIVTSRRALAMKLSASTRVLGLEGSLADLARAEGRAEAGRECIRALTRFGKEGVAKVILELAATRLSDTASGRGGDLARLVNDGRDEVLVLLRGLI